jgi:hypothetical protein
MPSRNITTPPKNSPISFGRTDLIFEKYWVTSGDRKVNERTNGETTINNPSPIIKLNDMKIANPPRYGFGTV